MPNTETTNTYLWSYAAVILPIASVSSASVVDLSFYSLALPLLNRANRRPLAVFKENFRPPDVTPASITMAACHPKKMRMFGL